MRFMTVFMIVSLWATSLYADVYTWTDERGTVNYTEDLSSVPKKYRKKVRHTYESAAPTPSAEAEAGKPADKAKLAAPQAPKADDPANKLYAGKRAAEWVSEINAAQSELGRLNARVKELADERKKAGDVANRADSPLLTSYNEAVTEYNSASSRFGQLVESARKAGVPMN